MHLLRHWLRHYSRGTLENIALKEEYLHRGGNTSTNVSADASDNGPADVLANTSDNTSSDASENGSVSKTFKSYS